MAMMEVETVVAAVMTTVMREHHDLHEGWSTVTMLNEGDAVGAVEWVHDLTPCLIYVRLKYLDRTLECTLALALRIRTSA
jgi:hypothetical protein